MGIALLAIGLGVVAGVLAGMFGVGGGILFVPTLTLGLGLTQLHAEATSLLAIIPTVAAGTWRQHRYGNVRLRPAVVIGLAAVAGVEGGVVVAERLPQGVLERLFGALMIVIAAQVAWRAWRRGRPAAAPSSGNPHNEVP
ncbi:MAG TPA: sulfite exporter TauE/SafE family protein [Gaiellaceae bacterium]|nr:sulfite exporter TauE/SafE family protein [Gaiellaceae bacterium]